MKRPDSTTVSNHVGEMSAFGGKTVGRQFRVRFSTDCKGLINISFDSSLPSLIK